LDDLRSLVIVLATLGDIAGRGGNAERARTAYREWLSLLERRSSAGPGNPNWQVDMVQPLFRLARLGDNARERLLQARRILGEADAKGTLNARQRSWIAQVEHALAGLPAADADSAVAQHPAEP
jgi:hypothetical protein